MSGKYALIIGNTEYTDPGLTQLTAPARDVEDFASVLRDSEICAFDTVNILMNQSASIVIAAIDEFFDQKKYDDLLVLYFSGHGIRDEFGSLYLAFKDTLASRLRRTAIKAADISEVMDQSRSKRQVLILDCCNSGAFPPGAKAEIGGTMGLIKAFQGNGRFVLTASNAIQFAYEGKAVMSETENSLFTHFLVKGLQGEADNNGDGNIAVDELYDYAFNEISKITPKQTPTKSATKQEGDIFLRQNMPLKDIKSIPLPPHIVAAIENPDADIRLGAVQSLTRLLNGQNLGLARSARESLERIEKEDDSRRVSQAAAQALEPIRQAEKAEKERKAREEAERIAAQKAEEERIALEKAEAERKAKQEAERLLAEQKADEERKVKKEAKRLAALKAKEERLAREKAEAERKAKQEAQQLKADQKAKEERKAREEAERIAIRKAEQERLAREKAENKDRETKRRAAQKADEAPHIQEKREADQRIKEAAEKAKELPKSTVQPKASKKNHLFRIITPFGLVLSVLCCLSIGFYMLVYLPGQNPVATPTSIGIAITTNPATIESTKTAIVGQTNTAIVNLTNTAIAKSTAMAISRSTSTANAIATVQSRNKYIEDMEAEAQLMYGPKSGSMSHNAGDGFVKTVVTNVSLKNFIAEATFLNPFSATTGVWDYGFLFRDQAGNNQYRLIITSERNWELDNHTGAEKSSLIDKGRLTNLNTSKGGSNTVWLLCQGNKGILYVNGSFIANLDLSERGNFGDVGIGTGFFSGNEIDGNSTGYQEFSVWNIP